MIDICHKYLRPATIISHAKTGSSEYYRLVMRSKDIAENSRPGQFVSIRCGNGLIFRRPFSVASSGKESIDLVYKALGKGTLWLSKRKVGEELDVMGPLGRGFDTAGRAEPVLVAGGSGIASLAFLAQELKPGVLFYGTRTKKDIVCLDYFRKWKILLSTEDGSAGTRGLVTGALRGFLSSGTRQRALYACGPKKMLKQTALMAENFNLSCQVSLEEMMACGVGACRGCVVAAAGGYRSVCKDGPVFNTRDLTDETW
jgi:dihydroorotate dehydrogenase electron transfer subunit